MGLWPRPWLCFTSRQKSPRGSAAARSSISAATSLISTTESRQQRVSARSPRSMQVLSPLALEVADLSRYSLLHEPDDSVFYEAWPFSWIQVFVKTCGFMEMPEIGHVHRIRSRLVVGVPAAEDGREPEIADERLDWGDAFRSPAAARPARAAICEKFARLTPRRERPRSRGDLQNCPICPPQHPVERSLQFCACCSSPNLR